MSKKYSFPYLKTPKFKNIGGDWRKRTLIPITIRHNDISNDGYGILGQFGFFNYFKITFDRSKYSFQLIKK